MPNNTKTIKAVVEALEQWLVKADEKTEQFKLVKAYKTLIKQKL